MWKITLCLYRLGSRSKEKLRVIFIWAVLVDQYLFRNCEVAISICQFIIASTAAYWYFSHLGNATFPLAKSFCRALTLQLGSIVFGSLILCIVWTLQIILELLHHFTKNQTISGNPVNNVCADYFVRCSRCCLACFERFVRFITKNAFLMMAISG